MTDTPARMVPRINPQDVHLQSSGQKWQVWYVVLPETATLADLNDCPKMWHNVQGNRQKAFRILDRVTIVSHDQSWVVPDALVAGATDKGVSFAPKTIRKIELDARTEKLASTADYRVVFLGPDTYAVQRKSDGHQMGDTFATPERAADYMDRLYPRAA